MKGELKPPNQIVKSVTGQLRCSKSSLKQNRCVAVVRDRWPLLRLIEAVEMCEKCVEIDKTIERYRRIIASVTDQFTLDQARELIAELDAKKAALHPDQAK